eukprot:1258393-Pleurochrysis_carterae.AAC.1
MRKRTADTFASLLSSKVVRFTYLAHSNPCSTGATLRAATPSRGQQSQQAAIALSFRGARATAVSSALPRTLGTQTNSLHSTSQSVQVNPVQLSQSAQTVEVDVDETSSGQVVKQWA